MIKSFRGEAELGRKLRMINNATSLADLRVPASTTIERDCEI